MYLFLCVCVDEWCGIRWSYCFSSSRSKTSSNKGIYTIPITVQYTLSLLTSYYYITALNYNTSISTYITIHWPFPLHWIIPISMYSKRTNVLFNNTYYVLVFTINSLCLSSTLYMTQGSAAYWWNLKKSGEGDYSTRHAGCPVLVGSKWGMSIYIPV